MPCRTSARRTGHRGSAAGNCAPATHPAAPRWRNDCRPRPGTAVRRARRQRVSPRRPPGAVPRCCSCLAGGARVERQHSAAHLVELQGFEQRLEVTLAEALIALALNDLEEARPDHVLGKDLKQQALSLGRRTVHQDATLTQALQILAVAGYAPIERLIIRVGRVLKLHAALAHAIDRVVDVAGAEGDVLDALAFVVVQELLDLRLVVLAFIERNADLAVRTGHGLGDQPGDL